jgi:hypothetical protein
VWAKMYKITVLACPILPFSTVVQATSSELPSLRRSSSYKRPDRQNPPAKSLLANTHKMSTERRQPNRHATQPSWIDPPPSRRRYAPVQAVSSHLTRTATLIEGQICPERSGQKACEKDGVERHQAICGHEAALLRRTPGNSRVPEAMVTSLVGGGDSKPVFWSPRVPCGVQTAARTYREKREGGVERHQARGRNAKSRSVILSGILPNGRISRRPGPSATAARTQSRPLRRTSSSRPQRALVGAPLFPTLALPNPPRAATAVCGYARAIAPTPQTTQLHAPLPPPPPCAPPTLGGIIILICRTSGRRAVESHRIVTYHYRTLQ